MFDPVNDDCIECGQPIDPKTERNYVVWQSGFRFGKKRRGAYRRECAKCHDTRLRLPFNRAKTSDAIMHSNTSGPRTSDPKEVA